MILIIILLILLIIIRKKYNETLINISSNPPFPIDIVYTWAGEKQSTDMRIANNNELKYSLRSIAKYLPWVNHIYILMNPPKKIPSWFNSNYSKYITLVDHTETFPNKKDLPSTNSGAIEFTIQNIPNLGEHYIYINDDFFIGQPLSYDFFFTSDGKAKVSKYTENTTSILKDPNNNPFGFKFPLTSKDIHFYPHIPIPIIKSQVEKFVNEYKEYVEWCVSIKKRHSTGCQICSNTLHCPCQQMQGPIVAYMCNNNKAIRVESPPSEAGVCKLHMIYSGSCIDQLDDMEKNLPKTFAINDTAMPTQRNYIYEKMLKFFEKVYPELPPWE